MLSVTLTSDRTKILSTYGSRLMYWTDWGTIPSIHKANLDGSNHGMIVQGELKWPNGLVIDAASQKLFWADAGLDKIETSNLLVKLRLTNTMSINTTPRFFRLNHASVLSRKKAC